MPIAGVVIQTEPLKAMDVLAQLNETPKITTYGVHKDFNIVAVFEVDSTSELEKLSQQITNDIPGILGIYPAYVNFEDVA